MRADAQLPAQVGREQSVVLGGEDTCRRMPSCLQVGQLERASVGVA